MIPATSRTIPYWEVKRVIELCSADPSTPELLRQSPEQVRQRLGLDWDPSWVLRAEGESCRPELEPYVRWATDMFRQRQEMLDTPADHPRYRAWRARQIGRLRLEQGASSSEKVIHSPATFELASGCSVGCWFCGISAGKLREVFPYTPEHGALWRGMLEGLQSMLGAAMKWAFCYWATDPLDNPDYELFCQDLAALTGVFPQTTTALALKDPARTRRLLKLSDSLGCPSNRFSILSLRLFQRVLEEFSAEEVARCELLGQNKESTLNKALAGKALQHPDRERATEATIACVSGLLVNMVERRVRLITPCRPGPRYPDGFQVYRDERFQGVEDFIALARDWYDRLPVSVEELPRVRPGRGLQGELTEHGFSIGSDRQVARLENPAQSQFLRALGQGVLEGKSSASELSLLLHYSQRVCQESTLELLQRLFDLGALDEEPDLWAP